MPKPSLDELLQGSIEQEKPRASWKMQFISLMEKHMNTQSSSPTIWKRIGMLSVAAGALAVVIGIAFILKQSPSVPGGSPFDSSASVKTFTSQEDFFAYLDKAQKLSAFGGYAYTLGATTSSIEENFAADPQFLREEQKSFDSLSDSTGASGGGRVSETNVQVQGIDEPDKVKTDGSALYIAGEQMPYWFDGPQPRVMQNDTQQDPPGKPLPDFEEKTNIVSAVPVDQMKLSSTIKQSGDLLLFDSTLVVFSSEGIFGYDVSDSASPVEKWKMTYENNTYLTTARAFNGKLYVVTQTGIQWDSPCPIRPLSTEEQKVIIDCVDIYHPTEPTATDVTFSVMEVQVADGAVKQSVSFVGSSGESVVYMSPENVYMTYTYPVDMFEFIYQFTVGDGSSILPASLIDKLKKVYTLDISQEAKQVEFNTLLEAFYRGLSDEERENIEEQFQEGIRAYAKERRRELETSSITRIDIDSLSVKATAKIPGALLNQFSMDEYKNHLRVGTTNGERLGILSNEDTVNDLYILNDSLQIVGSVKDLGEGERIYSTRFMGDVGYMVTFRQTDPLYVFDLSNPQKPSKTGELKIPGYSAYLHPLSDTRLLGVGREEGKVKISLFDVTDPSQPKEVSKYTIEDEYWSEVESDFHAFLQDEKYKAFFLPGGNGGYVFSYENDELKMKKKVENIVAQRAVYIGDHFYIIGPNAIIVLSEKTWEQVKEFSY